MDAANNVIEGRLRNYGWKYVMKLPNINPDDIKDLGSNCFLVPSESKDGEFYLIDMNMRTCTCPVGVTRGPCKHKMLVSSSKKLPSFDMLPTESAEMRRIWMFIGTGKEVGLEWFLPLQADGKHVNDTLAASDQPPQHRVAPDVVEQAQEFQPKPAVIEVETDDVKNRLERVLSKLQAKIEPRIGGDPAGYMKALDYLEKNIDRLPCTVDAALQKSLTEFGKSVNLTSRGLKRKKSGMIPVQVTAKSRRVYKLRGSRSAHTGRPRKEHKLAVQMNVDDDEEAGGVLRHKLPYKKRKVGKGNVHDLMSAVSEGRGPSKKH